VPAATTEATTEPTTEPATSSTGASPDSTASAVAGSAETSATTSAPPVVTKRTITQRKTIAFTTRTVKDDTLAEGETKVRTKGVPGVRTTTYEATLTDGKETARRKVGSVVTRAPVTE
jgi:hypothetical protein